MTQLEFLKDDWFTVQQIDHSTYAISEYGHWEKVHSFLLIGEHNASLIDTGNGIDNIKRVVDQLTDLPIIVITTHVHWDHIGSHGQFDEIYVHEAEMNWLLEGMPGLLCHKSERTLAEILPNLRQRRLTPLPLFLIEGIQSISIL
jgi:glyoxylase-like metal-dependent hydrolase (beta-lactamase superfamily II)